MDLKTVVLYISSDEEGWGETRVGGGTGGDDHDSKLELADRFDGEGYDNSDKAVKCLNSAAKDSDDDCVVLDGDPYKTVSIENDNAGESDDLLILGEKGEIACRDYPHPRHLCAKFPFTSTSHERHCDLCHCYVCDSHAPCVHWESGTSTIGHCHATDKEEFWRCQRKNFKQVDEAPSPVPKFLDSSISVGPPESNQFPPFQKPTARTSKIQGICQRSGYVVPRNNFPPCLVAQRLHSSHSNVIRKKRRHNVGSLGPQFLSSGTTYKRMAPLGFSLGTSRSGYNSSYTDYGSQYSRNPSPVLSSSRKNRFGRQDLM